MWRQSANHSHSLRWEWKTAPWEFQTKLLHYFFLSNNQSNLHFTRFTLSCSEYTFVYVDSWRTHTHTDTDEDVLHTHPLWRKRCVTHTLFWHIHTHTHSHTLYGAHWCALRSVCATHAHVSVWEILCLHTRIDADSWRTYFAAQAHRFETVCCSVLQCVAVCGSVMQCFTVCCNVLQSVAVCGSVLQCVTVCCSVLQRVAVCCSLLQYVVSCVCVTVCCSVLQCIVICCGVSKYVADVDVWHSYYVAHA